MKIAVLAVQGAFIEHEKKLEVLGAECFELRQKKDLDTEMTVVRPRAYKDEPDFIHDIFRNFNPQRFVNSAFSNPGPVNVVTVKHSQEPHLTEGPGGRRYRFQLATPYNVNATVTIPRGWVEIERTSFPGLLPITVTRFKRTDRNPAASRSTNGKPAEQEASKGGGNGN